MSWLNRLTLAAWGAFVALGFAFTAWTRRDARKDARQEAQIKDKERAHEIAERIAADRRDPKRVSKYQDRGYRD